MKKLYYEVKEHIKSDFNLGAYLYVIIFVAVALFLCYYLDFYKLYISPTQGKPSAFISFPILYFLAYYGTVIPILIIKKQTAKLKQSEFWVKSFVFIMLMSTLTAYTNYKSWLSDYKSNYYEYAFLFKILSNLKRFFPFIIVLGILKYFYDRKSGNFYGISRENQFTKPFILLLLSVLPLMAIASFLPDFQEYYPRFKYWNFQEVFGLNKLKMTLIFELAYGLDFVSTELFFRGALVVGMAKVLGKESVLAMVAVYVFIHIGKPFGESLSSMFGGYVLGIFAYNHKNISAGIIIHLGVAYMMEITAMLQYMARN